MAVELFKLETTTNGKKHQDINMGTLIANYMADDSVNKIDAQKFTGLDRTRDSKLSDLLERSDFITERQEAGRDLSTYGRVAVALVRVDGEYYINFYRVVEWESIKRKITMLTADSGVKRNVLIRNTQHEVDVLYKWRVLAEEEIINGEKYPAGRVVRNTIYYWKGVTGKLEEQEIDTETYVYPAEVKQVPAAIIKNNFNMMPDWMKAGDILQEINVLSNDMGVEWEKIKTQFQNTTFFNKGEKGLTIAEAIENGEWLHDVYSPNAKIAQSLQAIISGSSTTQTLIQQIVFLEDRAMKYAFQGRELDSSGTNKHNMQVGLFNQAHGEYNQVKKEQRERDYLYFFKNIVAPILDMKAPNNVNIQASIFEQGKIEGMKQIQAQRELYQSQTKAQSAQADKHTADAEVALQKETPAE